MTGWGDPYQVDIAAGRLRSPRLADLARIIETHPQVPCYDDGIPPSVRALFDRVSKKNGITVRQLLNGGKGRIFVRSRGEVAFELQGKGHSLSEIGRYLGGRHHTTISYAIGMHVGRLKASMAISEPGEIPCPDLSGEWAI